MLTTRQNTGRGFQEHRRSRSSGAILLRRSPENIRLPQPYSSWVQNRPIQVEPPKNASLPRGNPSDTAVSLEAYGTEKAADLRARRADTTQTGSDIVKSPFQSIENDSGDSQREISRKEETDPVIQGIRRMISRRDVQPALKLQSSRGSPIGSCSSLYEEIMSTVAMHEVAMADESHVTDRTDPESEYLRSNDHRRVRVPRRRDKPSDGDSSVASLLSHSPSQPDSQMNPKATTPQAQAFSQSESGTTNLHEIPTAQTYSSPHHYALHRQRQNQSVVTSDRSETRSPARLKAKSPPELARRSASSSTAYKTIRSGYNGTIPGSGHNDVFYDSPEDFLTPTRGDHRFPGLLGRTSQDSEPISDKLRRSLSLRSGRKPSESGGKENNAIEVGSASTKTVISGKSKEQSFTGRIGGFKFAASLSRAASPGTHQEASATGAETGYSTNDKAEKANRVFEAGDLQSSKTRSKGITDEQYNARRDFLIEIAEWMTDDQLEFAKSCLNTMPEEEVREMVRRWGPSNTRKASKKESVDHLVAKKFLDTHPLSELRDDWDPEIEEMGEFASGYQVEKSRFVGPETATIGSKLIDTYPEEKKDDEAVPVPNANMRAPAEGLRLRIQKAATLPGLPKYSGSRTQHKHFWGRDPETGMLRTMKQWWYTVDRPNRANDTYTINSDFSISVEKLDPNFRYCCGIDGCKESFRNSEVLLDHRTNDHAYCYCGPCKLDCGDFGGLVAHKVESDAHIACWVCSLDFNSIAGRDRHCKAVSSQPCIRATYSCE